MTILKQAQLKLIAFKCGLATSGTKPILLARILHELNRIASAPANNVCQRILSIDMGIRNLAYCTLDVNLNCPSPKIHAWRNLSVSMTPVNPVIQDAKEQQQTLQAKEAFDPASMSVTAYNLLREKLLYDKPTHVIIEQQRFRSMGGRHIFEWTIRVNMFEAILHGILCTLKAEKIWNGTVVSVAPLRVGPFWLGRDDDKRSTKNVAFRNKRRKIDLVKSWLENETSIVQLGNNEVLDVAERFTKSSTSRSSKSETASDDDGKDISSNLAKLDDLSDSLLQGLAWIQWEKNKKIALRYGVEALLES
ncbi:Cruciform cutting endonuclease 1, mitochondrial [Erysiphe neolycopersici]|uniref:Cruciform cutting endonuclease 1, mitochondrial n=1 Tax=Erysiphe neolycopersici TaxID=212602 RepID=A0A420I5K6_9PEZI|nr:Cruciform cutting endonuclease 1, mitochondrial [Erysiphe neolycopersici]